MCKYQNGLRKCSKLILAESKICHSGDREEVENCLNFIDKHIANVLEYSKTKYYVLN